MDEYKGGSNFGPKQFQAAILRLRKVHDKYKNAVNIVDVIDKLKKEIEQLEVFEDKTDFQFALSFNEARNRDDPGWFRITYTWPGMICVKETLHRIIWLRYQAEFRLSDIGELTYKSHLEYPVVVFPSRGDFEMNAERFSEILTYTQETCSIQLPLTQNQLNEIVLEQNLLVGLKYVTVMRNPEPTASVVVTPSYIENDLTKYALFFVSILGQRQLYIGKPYIPTICLEKTEQGKVSRILLSDLQDLDIQKACIYTFEKEFVDKLKTMEVHEIRSKIIRDTFRVI